MTGTQVRHYFSSVVKRFGLTPHMRMHHEVTLVENLHPAPAGAQNTPESREAIEKMYAGKPRFRVTMRVKGTPPRRCTRPLAPPCRDAPTLLCARVAHLGPHSLFPLVLAPAGHPTPYVCTCDYMVYAAGHRGHPRILNVTGESLPFIKVERRRGRGGAVIAS